jgi:hypothetical protein
VRRVRKFELPKKIARVEETAIDTYGMFIASPSNPITGITSAILCARYFYVPSRLWRFLR